MISQKKYMVLIDKHNRLKEIISQVNSDVVLMINVSAIVERHLKVKETTLKQFVSLEEKMDAFIEKHEIKILTKNNFK